MSRAYTKEEVQQQVVKHFKMMVNYWAECDGDDKDKLHGLAFSILVMLDGGSCGMPAFDLIPSPHPDDKKYHKENNENWYERKVINDCQLHELFCMKDEE